MKLKGRITRYFPDRGYSFIQDEKGTNRFFHVTSLAGHISPYVGARVTFAAGQNSKGLTTEQVNVLNGSGPKFIKLGNLRLDLNNIKDYGINVEKRMRTVPLDGFDKKFSLALGIVEILTGIGGPGDVESTKKEEVICKVLYIQTYQNEMHEFVDYEVDFDLSEKLKELDNLLA